MNQKYIYFKYRKYFKLNNWLLKLAGDLNKIYQNKSITIEPETPEGIVVLFFAKGYKTHKAIWLLCKRGLGLDATILLRSLFEAIVSLRYILKKPKERVELFLQYDYVQRKHMLDATRKDTTGFISEELKKVTEKEQRITQSYEKIKSAYPNEFKWSNKSIKKMAQEVGLEGQYNFIYSILSNIAHLTPRSSNEYLRETKDKKFLIDIKPSDKWLEQVLPTSYIYFVVILEEFNKVFKLGLKEEIEKAKQKMMKQEIINPR